MSYHQHHTKIIERKNTNKKLHQTKKAHEKEQHIIKDDEPKAFNRGRASKMYRKLAGHCAAIVTWRDRNACTANQWHQNDNTTQCKSINMQMT
jgi:hypothetical protein